MVGWEKKLVDCEMGSLSAMLQVVPFVIDHDWRNSFAEDVLV